MKELEEIKSFPCNICDYDIKVDGEEYCSQGGKLTKVDNLTQCPAEMGNKSKN